VLCVHLLPFVSQTIVRLFSSFQSFFEICYFFVFLLSDINVFIKFLTRRAPGNVTLRFENPLELFPFFLYQVLIEFVKCHYVFERCLCIKLIEVLFRLCKLDSFQRERWQVGICWASSATFWRRSTCLLIVDLWRWFRFILVSNFKLLGSLLESKVTALKRRLSINKWLRFSYQNLASWISVEASDNYLLSWSFNWALSFIVGCLLWQRLWVAQTFKAFNWLELVFQTVDSFLDHWTLNGISTNVEAAWNTTFLSWYIDILIVAWLDRKLSLVKEFRLRSTKMGCHSCNCVVMILIVR